MQQLYKVLGISKQAVQQRCKRQNIYEDRLICLLPEAQRLRSAHPGCGVEKLYYCLKPSFIGRDRFIEAFMDFGFRLKRKKNYRRTTTPSTTYYSNLIKGLQLSGASQVWQSDITYIPVGDKHFYAVFIIDVYTKKIVGYQVSDHMRATANIQALQMALKTNRAPEYHHSDRGSQYNSKEYIKILTSHDCKISMGVSGQDNAYAERINRTVKEEYLNYWKPKSKISLKWMVRKAVRNYNSIRPHYNLNMKSPNAFEIHCSKLNKNQRPILTIFENKLM